MILTKDKGGLKFLVMIFMLIPISVHGYCAWKGGFGVETLKIHLYLSPISLLFILFSWSICRSLKNRIIASETGLIIEDFSKEEFPWRIIRNMSTKSQLLPKGGSCLWLILKTECDEKYHNSKIKRMNRLIGIDGIPVCNLAIYSKDIQRLLEYIQKRIAIA